MEILSIENVTKNFGGVVAVSNVSAEIQEGTINCLIGPNGAGKTTLFNLITGGYKLTTGRILFKDKEISSLRPSQIHMLGISRTFQNIRLFQSQTVIENVAVGKQTMMSPKLHHWLVPAIGDKLEKQVFESAMHCLERCGLATKTNDRATDLAYGQQRYVEIARALVSEPEILLLDEPAAGMNNQETMDLLAFIKALNEEMKKTIILIEHNMKFVMTIADRVIVLDHGKLIADGRPEEVQSNQQVIDAYLGVGENKLRILKGRDKKNA